MTKNQLLARLIDITKNTDPESAHHSADESLLEYIDDEEIENAFKKLERWYS